MNILGRKQETLVDATSRIGELYNKFEEYQQKRGNIEEAFSLLRGYILEEKQLGLYPLHEDENITIFLDRMKLEGDELFAMVNYNLKYEFKNQEQKKYMKAIINTSILENRIKLNIEEIESYKDSIVNNFNLLLKIEEHKYNTTTFDGETNISKELFDVDMKNTNNIRYLESLIFRLEDNEDFSQDIKRVYKTKKGIYVIVLSDGSEINLVVTKAPRGLHGNLFISCLLKDVNSVLKYEPIIQENVVDKYKDLFQQEKKSSNKMTTKQKLFTLLSFGLYKAEIIENNEGKESLYEGELLEGEAVIREIEKFYKTNMALDPMELGVDIGIHNMEFGDYSNMVLKDIRTKVETFLDEGKSIFKISIVQKSIEFWKEIRKENIGKIAEYIVKYNLLKGIELEDFLKKFSKVEGLDIKEITTEKIFLDPMVQNHEIVPYELGAGKKTVLIHSSNKGLVIYDRETKEEEFLVIPGTYASFSPDMRYVLLTEEEKEGKESYTIYNLEERKTIKEFQVAAQGYAWHVNMMTDNFFLQVSIDSMHIAPIDGPTVDLGNLDIDMFAVSKDKDNKYIFIVREKKVVMYDRHSAQKYLVSDFPDNNIILDIISTKKGINIIYTDLEYAQVVVSFIRIKNDGNGDNDWESPKDMLFKFKGDFQPMQNIIRISPDNKNLLAIKRNGNKPNIVIFDIEDPSIVEVASIDNIEGNIEQIEFSTPDEITYIVDNNVYIVNIKALQILSKKKKNIPPSSRLLGTGIGVIIKKPRSKVTDNPFPGETEHERINRKMLNRIKKRKNKLLKKKPGNGMSYMDIIDNNIKNRDKEMKGSHEKIKLAFEKTEKILIKSSKKRREKLANSFRKGREYQTRRSIAMRRLLGENEDK